MHAADFVDYLTNGIDDRRRLVHAKRRAMSPIGMSDKRDSAADVT